MHHSNKDGVFELVDKDVHRAFAHTGGAALKGAEGAMLSAAGAVIPNFKGALEEGQGAGGLALGFTLDVGVALDPSGIAPDYIDAVKNPPQTMGEAIEVGRKFMKAANQLTNPGGEAIDMAKDFVSDILR